MELISQKELASKLGVTRQTLYRWRKDGLPAEISRGRLIRFNYDKVVSWLQDNRPDELGSTQAGEYL